MLSAETARTLTTAAMHVPVLPHRSCELGTAVLTPYTSTFLVFPTPAARDDKKCRTNKTAFTRSPDRLSTVKPRAHLLYDDDDDGDDDDEDDADVDVLLTMHIVDRHSSPSLFYEEAHRAV